MSKFSTTVTKAQRNAQGRDAHGFAVSPDSRHNINSPGYNRSPFEPLPPKRTGTPFQQIVKVVLKEREEKKSATIQVRPETKRGQRRAPAHSKDVLLPEIPMEAFFATSCELTMPVGIFTGIYSISHGQPCIGCSYDVHNKTGCLAKQQLLRERGLWK